MVPELTSVCGCVWVSSMFRGSGGQLGGALLAVFRRLLNPLQVGDLADGGPRPTLQRFASCPRLRILCCGGDGTVAWVMSAVDELHMACSPAVAILPLGTGNDFARVMQWGGGAGGSVSLAMARRWLRAVADSHVSIMDRWMVAIQPMPATDAAPPSSGKKPRDTNASAGGGSGAGTGAGAGGSGVRRRRCGRRRGGGGRTSTPKLPPGIPPERKVMNIYMGIGVGAQVALQVCMCTVVYVYGCVCVFVCVYWRLVCTDLFLRCVFSFTSSANRAWWLHVRTTLHDLCSHFRASCLAFSFPHLFCSRLVNKVWYSQVGGVEILRNSCAEMWKVCTLVCDGVDIPLPPGTQVRGPLPAAHPHARAMAPVHDPYPWRPWVCRVSSY